MKLSFKYKFIFSFAAVEVFFIALIVSFNFSSISSLSKTLVNEKIQVTNKMFSQLIKTPMMISDIATIDDAVLALGKINHIAAIEVFNNENKIISNYNDDKIIYKDMFIKNFPKAKINNRAYILNTFPVKIEDEILGKVKIIIEATDYIKFIEKNKKLTYLLILFEVLFSATMAYIIGNQLTSRLEALTVAAEQIANNNKTKIPYTKSKSDEISILADALESMQEKVFKRDKELRKLSTTDALTQLLNRRYFNEIFEKELSRAKRDKKIFCLLSLDIDNFKSYNDTYGHQMGDDVLANIGQILKASMKRSSDFAFRIGGEEFSAIYNASDEKYVYEFAENLRKAIEDLNIEHKGNSVAPFITASFGVLYIDFHKNSDLKTNQKELYTYADELLYKAKESGKNKVIVHDFLS